MSTPCLANTTSSPFAIIWPDQRDAVCPTEGWQEGACNQLLCQTLHQAPHRTAGFADDVLDVPWRVKLLLPSIASLPLLIAYSGGTAVGVPKPLRALLSALPPYLEIGPLYQLYMVHAHPAHRMLLCKGISMRRLTCHALPALCCQTHLSPGGLVIRRVCERSPAHTFCS